MEYSNVFMVNVITGKIRIVRLNDTAGSFYNEAFGKQVMKTQLTCTSKRLFMKATAI